MATTKSMSYTKTLGKLVRQTEKLWDQVAKEELSEDGNSIKKTVDMNKKYKIEIEISYHEFVGKNSVDGLIFYVIDRSNDRAIDQGTAINGYVYEDWHKTIMYLMDMYY